LKIIEIENSKRKKATPKETKAIIEKKKEILKEVEVKVEEIRVIKKEKKLKPIIEKPKAILKVGDRVRMIDGKAVGSIDNIEKNKATVNYGIFTSKMSLDQLELVEAVKR
jgi:DNA mismatch repair protein MutS2